jgi:hypothetical protein
MARKILNVTITAEGRDKGKVFRLTEMPASRAEKWAVRAFLMLSRAGVEVPDGLQDAGLVGLAVVGLEALTKVSYSEAEPLLDEMMECVTILPDPTRDSSERRLVEEDIEEVPTRLRLRRELWGLHVDFIPGVAELRTQAVSAASETEDPSLNTRTAQG